MKIRIIGALLGIFLTMQLHAQQLKQIGWESYGLKFKAPVIVKIESDDEESFNAKGGDYELNIQMLESEGMNTRTMGEELKQLATEDEMQHLSAVQRKDNKQFFIAYIKGQFEDGPSLYAYLLAKDSSCAFLFILSYKDSRSTVPETILPTFQLVD